MRCYTNSEAGIRVDVGPYPHIFVGEKGRGREHILFPVGARFFESLKAEAKLDSWGDVTVRVERASVIRTQEKGTLLLVEEQDPKDQRALVLVKLHGGFRGAAFFKNPEPIECARAGEIADDPTLCSLCGAEYVTAGWRSYVHPNWQPGTVTFNKLYPAAPETFDFLPGVRFLAAGYGAEGDAGRAGGPHWEALVIMEPGARLRVAYHGRLYGRRGYDIVEYRPDMGVRVAGIDELDAPSCEVPTGEVL